LFTSRVLMFALVFLLAIASVTAINWPSLRLLQRHSTSRAESYLKRLQSQEAEFNHDYPGYSCRNSAKDMQSFNFLYDQPPEPSFEVLNRKVVVGKGRKCYDSVQKKILNFDVIKQLGWATVINPNSNTGLTQMNTVIGTLVQCYKVVWALNPCRIVEISKGENVSQIAFSTLEGHLLSGEERFRVSYDKTTEVVTLDMYSFSKAANVLGTLSLPLIRPLQRHFFTKIGEKTKDSCCL